MSNGHGRSRRMEKSWDAIPGGIIALTTNSTALIGILSSLVPNTVLRMIGEYIIMPTSAPTALDGCKIAVGVGVVSTDAALLGSTAMPDPSDQAEYPWLYWAEHDFYFPTNTATNAASGASVRQAFDVRSMRRIKPGQSCVTVVQYVANPGTPPMRVAFSNVRQLLAT